MPVFYDEKRGEWRLKRHNRIPGTNRYKNVDRGFGPGTAGRMLAQKADIAVEEELNDGSLTSTTISECVDNFIIKNGSKGFSKSIYSFWKERLGKMSAESNKLSLEYDRSIEELKSRRLKVNTINNYRSVFRRILNFSYQTYLIEKVMIRRFGLERATARDRIFQGNERLKLENVMQEEGSWMLPHLDFLSHNPVRINDCLNLRVTDYDKTKRVVTFWASKTHNATNAKMAYCGEISESLHNWFCSLPSDCPYLFPRLTKNDWHRPNYNGCQKHFLRMLKKAGIPNFTIHDLKHVATTYMLSKRHENGVPVYTIEDLKKLGLSLTERIIMDVYYNREAMDIISESRSVCSHVVNNVVAGGF